ncbi:hypothetical protein Tco_0614555 [Tanacetum coccineum]
MFRLSQLNVTKLGQLEKQLIKNNFMKLIHGCFRRTKTTGFSCHVNFQYYFDDDDGLIIRKYFLAYTQTEVRQFRDTLTNIMESIKKSIDKRAQHKREYNSRVNERQMQSKEGKVNSSKALDASLVVTECNGTESDKQDTSRDQGMIQML